MENPASADLAARWRNGDQQAAEEMYRRHQGKLLALVKRRLGARLLSRVDAEDVLQSAYQSFFTGVRSNRYVLQRRGDLWRLLAAITLHKLQHQVRQHRAARRSVDHELRFAGESALAALQADAAVAATSATNALEMADELEQVLRPLKPLHRRMVELRLQGYRIEEIATATQRSQRLVRLVLEQVRGELRRRYDDGLNS
jgi:RNA polymerase sigma-70 factor (ECF subfamily)